jgi:hypothetical protein
MAQALVAQPGCKASKDNPTDDEPNLLNFPQWSPGCVGLTQGNWIVRFGVPDGPVSMLPGAGPAFFVCWHEDVEGGLWALLWLPLLILLALAILWTFQLDHH